MPSSLSDLLYQLEIQPPSCLLDLSDRCLKNQGLISVFNTLNRAKNQVGYLESLDLSHNELTNEATEIIAEFLSSGWHVATIDLSCNSIWNINHLCRSRILNQLTCLDLTNNHLNDQALKVLANAILTKIKPSSSTRHSKHKNPYNYISPVKPKGDDAITPAKSLPLQSLFLDQNCFTDSGVEHLAEALRNNDTITELSVTDNRLRDRGVDALANMLKDNNAIVSLSISGNIISGITYGTH